MNPLESSTVLFVVLVLGTKADGDEEEREEMHLQVRHSGESWNPRAPEQAWIPAFAGMTNRVIPLAHATRITA